MSTTIPHLSRNIWWDVCSKGCPPAQFGRLPEALLFVAIAEVSPDACDYPEYRDAFDRLRI